MLLAQCIWHSSRPINDTSGRGNWKFGPSKSFVGRCNIDVSRPLAGLQTHTNTVVCFIKMHSDASSKYNSTFSLLFVFCRPVMAIANLLHPDKSPWLLLRCMIRCTDAFCELSSRYPSIQIIRLSLLAALFVFLLRCLGRLQATTTLQGISLHFSLLCLSIYGNPSKVSDPIYTIHLYTNYL